MSDSSEWSTESSSDSDSGSDYTSDSSSSGSLVGGIRLPGVHTLLSGEESFNPGLSGTANSLSGFQWRPTNGDEQDRFAEDMRSCTESMQSLAEDMQTLAIDMHVLEQNMQAFQMWDTEEMQAQIFREQRRTQEQQGQAAGREAIQTDGVLHHDISQLAPGRIYHYEPGVHIFRDGANSEMVWTGPFSLRYENNIISKSGNS